MNWRENQAKRLSESDTRLVHVLQWLTLQASAFWVTLFVPVMTKTYIRHSIRISLKR